MNIKYYGHSCFAIESGGFTVVLDPYDPSVPGYPALHVKANKVFCSHGHGDHSYTDAVELFEGICRDPYTVTEFVVPHDHSGGAKRGMNTIRVLEAEGKKIVHFGDTGCIPSDRILDQLMYADAVLIPVGGYYTIDPEESVEIAERICPKLVIPMHYKKGSTGLPVIAELDSFLDTAKDSVLCIRPMEYLEQLSI